MGCRKEEGKEAGSGTPSKSRACLFVSLIVLIWNIGATWRHMPVSRRPETQRADLSRAAMSESGAVSGPMTARQEYLLGKRVDVNRATYEEINALPGISDTVARAVVEEREMRGGFRYPEELLDIPGIKEKRLKKILPFLAEFHNN